MQLPDRFYMDELFSKVTCWGHSSYILPVYGRGSQPCCWWDTILKSLANQVVQDYLKIKGRCDGAEFE